ncbi:single-stranded DNA-binding protein [Gallibacterium sp. AGMB14963]|uniref:single-stranded DNA-binding protein n=1 Tax=Gallibacterium faecale TaxID=3019086 RepID=UPI0022F171DF|nr:single-stranded DNA-binding protein [Gallibacterium sp. AGMB14963]MDA3978059.1 single-stranded DNA-binding protein [Gallibacterium sp. AGMB14963]
MPNGDLTALLSVATSRVWKDKNGERQELTEWHRIVLYRRSPAIYVRKNGLMIKM